MTRSLGVRRASGIIAVMRARVALYFMALPLIGFQTAKRMPYTAVNDPEFAAASAATFLSDGDRLIGITSGKIAKAYPAAILAQHGVVLDDLPEGPIAVTW
jgi:uncharacterized protein DUF3179